jgi:hypothetical protein
MIPVGNERQLREGILKSTSSLVKDIDPAMKNFQDISE